ncbi:MAG: hypothetical protein ACQEXQ_22290 [Bacillota bacterium]
MRRRFMLLVCGFLLLTLLLPFQAAAADDWSSEVLLNEFNGTILDFDESRIVWKQTGDKVLWLYNRMDGSQVKVHDATGTDDTLASGREGVPAKLSAEGVVYTLWNNFGPMTYLWKEGAVRQIAEKQFLNEVKGNFAVLMGSVMDLTTGESRTLPNSGFVSGNRLDLSTDGTVVYTDPTYRSNLYKSLPDGTLMTFVPPKYSYLTYYGPLTDGNNIVYSVLTSYVTGSFNKWAIRLRDADDKITMLAINPFYGHFYNHRATYQINNGWITYQEYNKEKDNWILYVRSPEGETRQIFETPSQSWKQSWYSRDEISINQLGADGSVVYMVYYGKLKYTNTYLYSTQSDKHVRVSNGPAEFQYWNGAWYRMTSNSLFAIQI